MFRKNYQQYNTKSILSLYGYHKNATQGPGCIICCFTPMVSEIIFYVVSFIIYVHIKQHNKENQHKKQDMSQYGVKIIKNMYLTLYFGMSCK
jgi:hypothetical protein